MRRRGHIALVTLNQDQVERYAKENGVSYKDQKSLAENPKVHDLIRRAVADANSQLASYETIKNFAIIPEDFSIENGELTPSLKVKRKVVDEKFKTVIDHLYPDA